MARSTSLFGPYKDKVGGLATSNQFSNLLYRSADVIAPGHNANFVQDDAGQWLMLYHGYDAMNVDGGRKVYLSQIFWDEDGWPYVRDMKPTLGAPCPLIGEQYTGIETPKLSPDSMGDEHVSVYPQMTRRDITVSHDGDIDFTYQVVNLQGTVITSGKAHGSTTIDLYAQPIGMYIVTVSSATGIHTEKVIRY
jgi:beta-xylosidase